MATSGFGKAFRAARSAGDKTFEFNGKKYTTEMASEAAQPSVGGKVSREYKPRDFDARRGENITSKNAVPRDFDARKGENITSKNAVPRDEYVRSGRQSFDVDTEFVPPDMSAYKPRRTAEEGMKKGGAVSASKRADGIAQRGKTRGKVC
jgi:hypothetical protein